MVAPVCGELFANLALADPIAREVIAVLAMLRGRALGGPALHGQCGGFAQAQAEELVDAADGPERIRMELPLVDIVELTGPSRAYPGGAFDRAAPIGAFPRPDHLRPRRVALEHAAGHMQRAAERSNGLHGVAMRVNHASIGEHR